VHCLPLLSVNLGKPKMKTHTFNCEKCGNITKILVDGYPFGDRRREGVMFEVTVKANKLICKLPSDDYTKQLNIPLMEKNCLEYLGECENDVVGQCKKCGEDASYEVS